MKTYTKEQINDMREQRADSEWEGLKDRDLRAHQEHRVGWKNIPDEEIIEQHGRMVDKSRIVDGLCEIKNVLEHAQHHHHDFTRKDYLYFEEVIEAAKDYLLED